MHESVDVTTFLCSANKLRADIVFFSPHPLDSVKFCLIFVCCCCYTQEHIDFSALSFWRHDISVKLQSQKWPVLTFN